MNSFVYTDDQGNTYTILQLCKKVLKAIDSIEIPYYHHIKFSINSVEYEVVIKTTDEDKYLGWTDISNLVARLNGAQLSGDTGFGKLYGVVSFALYNFGNLTIAGWVVDDRGTPSISKISAGQATFISDTVLDY